MKFTDDAAEDASSQYWAEDGFAAKLRPFAGRSTFQPIEDVGVQPMRPQSSRALRESSITIIAALLVACGGPQKSEPPPPSVPSPEAPVTVSPAPTEPVAAAVAPAPVAVASPREPEPSASPLIVSVEPRSG